MPFQITYRLAPAESVGELSDYLNDTGSSDFAYHIDSSDDDDGLVVVIGKDQAHLTKWVESGLGTYGLRVIKKDVKPLSDAVYADMIDQ